MKRPYYLFSNGRLRRHQNSLRLERADNERTPGADLNDDEQCVVSHHSERSATLLSIRQNVTPIARK